MMAYSEDTSLDKYICPICLDVFEEPVTIPCGNNHVVCNSCVKPLLKDKNPPCSVCRTPINGKVTKHKNLNIELQSTMASCPGCKAKVRLSRMREHQGVCDQIDRSVKLFEPVKETTQKVPRDLPNRSTFGCPYCDKKNLDARDLISHCNKGHKNETTPVVCPVCASMPWGDKGQKSSNFIHHLNLRHKFEYETYVDYNQDDDAMLKAALKASLEEP